ncbi:AraC-like DNA-binding protein [Dysgonomonas alginatilytica]|uniref:AraC-like DNA-binding protein n=1 Tax=Dysgonomonas alginatilytica TaxID=1605892 RepID=A0A2V3PJD8_9BACT|nr:AraC family transcriptional regulator [Dysgonomonas alginatilytica]PXV57148.1 AraC-like DNA-binding protein [Dysgonomonas alginatilytica]
MEFQRNESLTFSYSDIFFTYLFDNDRSCASMVKNHVLVYIYSGELIVEQKNRKTIIRAGECVFLRRDNRVNLTKQPKGDKHFKGIFMLFNRNFLREFYQTIDKNDLPNDAVKGLPSVVKLPQTPDIASLFQSMTPYFDSSIKPVDQLMQLKVQEGVYSLLNIDRKFYPILFDFTEPWKIDILDFMEENYMYDLDIEEIAHFTGRSLASFKRDFKKVSTSPPQKWLIEKRLKVAHDKIRNENKKVSDVYLEVGFKNLSHFSSAFKKQFGYSPTQ